MKRINKKAILILSMVLIFAFVLTGCPTKTPAKKEAPKTTTPATNNGAFMKDDWPNGCLSCHEKSNSKYNLNAEVKKIQGHPTVTANEVKECYACHSRSTQGLYKFQNGLHRIHLRSESKFITSKKANCMACHKFSKDSGEIMVKGLEGMQIKKGMAVGTAGTQGTTPGTTTPGTTTPGTGGTTTPGTTGGTTTPGTTTR